MIAHFDYKALGLFPLTFTKTFVLADKRRFTLPQGRNVKVYSSDHHLYRAEQATQDGPCVSFFDRTLIMSKWKKVTFLMVPDFVNEEAKIDPAWVTPDLLWANPQYEYLAREWIDAHHTNDVL